MEQIIEKLEAANISIYNYEEKGKLCGYELNTYTDAGVNEILFIDFRDTDKNPKSEADFKQVFTDRIKDINIDEVIDTNRQNEAYKRDFTLTQSLKDFKSWKSDLLKLAKKL